MSVLVALCACALPVAAYADCPNEALRQQTRSLHLPECRAYEMVSPVEKEGGEVNPGEVSQTDASGEAVSFTSKEAFAGAPTSLLGGYYIATRNTEGWSTQSIEAPEINSSGFLVQPTQAISEDLSQSIQASQIALAPGAVTGNGNVYIRDNLTGARTLVATSADPGLFQAFASVGGFPVGGATSNFSHVVLQSSAALAPEALAGVGNVYDYANGELELVSRLSNGAPAPNGASVGGTVADPHVISKDGSKIFFSAGSTGSEGVYLRENDTSTIPISLSQRVGASAVPAPALFVGASADGSVAYFISTENLTEASDTHGRETLYRYEVAKGLLTDLGVSKDPADSEGGWVRSVLDISEDGSYVYFSALGTLAPGATSGETNIYVWHDGETKFITTLNPQTAGDEYAAPGGGVVGSPNGLHLAFGSFSRLTSYDNTGDPACPANLGVGSPEGYCQVVYDYDYTTGSLRCVSCNPDGAKPSGWANLGKRSSVLDDGRVFFESPEALLPQDTNGEYDVYQWQDGRLALISSGHSAQASTFAAATPDASNVFFVTSEQLVGQDIDDEDDLYDARVNGGIAGQSPPAPPTPCEGEECQASPAGAPTGANPASSHVAVSAEVDSRVVSKPREAARLTVQSISSRERTTIAKSGELTLRIVVSAAGRIAVLARAEIGRRIATVANQSKQAQRAGTITVTARLTEAAREQLARKGRLKLVLSVSYSKVSGVKTVALVLSAPRTRG